MTIAGKRYVTSMIYMYFHNFNVVEVTYILQIKAMNWHRILIKLLEKEEDCNSVDSRRKFVDFQEVSFPTTERHNDMGQLLKYLSDHDCQYAFKELFGIEGKFSKLSD